MTVGHRKPNRELLRLLTAWELLYPARCLPTFIYLLLNCCLLAVNDHVIIFYILFIYVSLFFKLYKIRVVRVPIKPEVKLIKCEAIKNKLELIKRNWKQHGLDKY